jgi:hypothetical protein
MSVLPFGPKVSRVCACTAAAYLLACGAANAQPPAAADPLHAILRELAGIPQPKGDYQSVFRMARTARFAAKALEEFKADYKNLLDFTGKGQQFPVRAAVAEAVAALKTSSNVSVRSHTPSVVEGQRLSAFKAELLAEQKTVAVAQATLKEALQALLDVEGLRGGEGKRWQVLYDFVLLRVRARLVYLREYNFVLGRVRTDNLPDLGPNDRLWRLVPSDKLTSTDLFAKQQLKELRKGWERLINDYPGTPWAYLGQRESSLLLGLAWQPAPE